jgi:hypothetical protein
MVATVDDGTRRQEIVLQHRDVGLVIAPKIWHAVSRFTANAVLAVLASNPYDETDHIRDYAEFLSIAGGN